MKNRRKICLLLLCTIALMFAPIHGADAFWKGVGKWSGPGPFFGVDFVFPWSLATTDLNLPLAAFNEKLLNDLLGDQIPELSLTVLGFLQNPEHAKFYGEVLGIEKLKDWTPNPDKKDSDEEIERLVDDFISIHYRSQSPVAREVGLRNLAAKIRLAGELFQEMDSDVWRKKSDELGNAIRNYGSGWVGLFHSQQALPELKDPWRPKSALNNWFFMLNTGYAFSVKNDLDYDDPPIEGNSTVHVLSIYPSIEYRFGLNQPCPDKKYVKSNWFWNVGPAFQYVIGEQFTNFTRFSVRTRFGRKYRGVYFGVELDYLIPIENHDEQFGSVEDGDPLRFSYSGFLGIEFRRMIGN